MHSQVSCLVWSDPSDRDAACVVFKKHKKVIPLTKSSNMRTPTDIRLEFVE